MEEEVHTDDVLHSLFVSCSATAACMLMLMLFLGRALVEKERLQEGNARRNIIDDKEKTKKLKTRTNSHTQTCEGVEIGSCLQFFRLLFVIDDVASRVSFL
jgi:hypothetical protein